MKKTISLNLFLLIGFGIILRFWNVFDNPTLWLDEIISVKFAESPIIDVLFAVLRFDTHPPLYYLQLYVWSQFGTSDAWYILNSALLDLLVIASIAYTIGRLYGSREGVWAAAIYAILPMSIFFAENVRMYSMFFLEIVWLFYFLEIRVRAQKATIQLRSKIVILGIAATLTHGLGFFVVFFVWFQAIARLLAEHKPANRKLVFGMVLDYLFVAPMALYSLGIALIRQTEGLAELSFSSVGIHLTINFFGMNFPWPAISGYIGLILIVLPTLSMHKSRHVTIFMICLPFLSLLMLSLFVKTVFMFRTLALFTPFLAITLGLFFNGIWTDARLWRKPLVIFVVAALCGASVNSASNFEKMSFQRLASVWEHEASPKAILLVNDPQTLWGISRYLEATPQYSALDIQAPVRAGMKRLKEKLGGTVIDKVGLFGASDRIVVGQRTLLAHIDRQVINDLSTYWIFSVDDGTCVRSTDSIKRVFKDSNFFLVECVKQT